MNERQNVSWTEVVINVTAADDITYAVPMWRRDVVSTNLTDAGASEGLIEQSYVALAVDGNAYQLSVANGASSALASTAVYARGSLAVDESWLQADGSQYTAIALAEDLASPAGHEDVTLLLTIVARDGEALPEAERPLLYFDAHGLAEHAISSEGLPQDGFYRTGDGISSPIDEPEPIEAVTLGDVTFDLADSAELSGFIQLGTLQPYAIRGYGGELVDTELQYRWEQREVEVFVGETDERVPMSVQVQVTISVDISDPDFQQAAGEIIVAQASNGDAYILATNESGVVTGLADEFLYARKSIALGDVWQQSDGRTYRVLTVAPVSSSPSGHDELELILEVMANEDGDLAAENRPRLYYDASGFAEESIQRTSGRYRLGDEDDEENEITPPDAAPAAAG